MAHHNNIPPDQGAGVISIILTALASIWTSIALEVTHGIITIGFAVGSCVIVYFVQRFLKKRFP